MANDIRGSLDNLLKDSDFNVLVLGDGLVAKVHDDKLAEAIELQSKSIERLAEAIERQSESLALLMNQLINDDQLGDEPTQQSQYMES